MKKSEAKKRLDGESLSFLSIARKNGRLHIECFEGRAVIRLRSFFMLAVVGAFLGTTAAIWVDKL